MKVENYYRAKTIDDAYNALIQSPKNMILGGGLWIKKNNPNIDTLIDLTDLKLNQIKLNDGIIEIGAMALQKEVEDNELIKNLANGILSNAISEIMGVGFRNMATIGGSVYGKYPFSDIITPLLVLDTTLHFYPKRSIKLEDYLNEKEKRNEILLSISLKNSDAKTFFKKVKVTALDFPILNVAISNDKGSYKIAVGSRPMVASLALRTMEYMNGKSKPTKDDYKVAGELAGEELKYLNSTNASSEYRKQLAKTYVMRGLEEVSK